MKKSVAIGAAVATTLGTTLLSATGSQATPMPDCATFAEYESSVTGSAPSQANNWVTSCVPQFGFGKAEFTLSSDVDFPADFKPLTDPSVSLTTDLNVPAAEAYLGQDLQGMSLTQWIRWGIRRTDNGTNPRSQSYSLGTENSAVFPFHIHSITRVSTATVTAAAGCNNPTTPYTDAFIIDYDPVSLTVSQEAGGQTWTTTITADPESIQVGFVFDGSGSPTATGASLCILRGPMVYGSHDPSGFSDAVISVWGLLTPYPAVNGPQNGALGNFEFTHQDKKLANTGLASTEIYAWLTAGFALVLAGGVGLGAGRRRKRSR